MKKYITFIIAGISFLTVKSQTVSDALLYSKDIPNGTARFSAMSGAFGALGGDFSAININPAGSAIFSNNQASLTLTTYNVKNKSEYFGSKISTRKLNFDINQAGGALIFFNTDEKSSWKKFVLSVDYENAANYDNAISTIGTNPNQSVTDYFLSYANPGLYNSNIPLSSLQGPFYDDFDIRTEQAYLGYQGYAINADPNNSNNNTYVANHSAGDFYQVNEIDSNGYNGKVAFNFASQYTDKFYFGFNLNSHFIDYKKNSIFYEKNDNSQVPTEITKLLFGNDRHTYGNGFSFQLGAIAKVTPALRAGLSYQSPTWYSLVDEKTQFVASSSNSFPNI